MRELSGYLKVKRNYRRAFACLTLLAAPGFFGYGFYAETADASVHKSGLILEILKRFHYNKDQTLDEKLARLIQSNFLARLDPRGLYFLGKDIKKLKEFLPTPDERGARKREIFFNRTLALYYERLEETRALIQAAARKRPDYRDDNEIEFYAPDDIEYAENNSERKKRWELFIKHRVLSQVFFETSPANQRAFETAVLRRDPEIRKEIMQKQINLVNGILNHPQGFRPFLATLFLQILTQSFDPHSQYLPRREKRRFEASLSTRGFSFGLVYSRDIFGETRIKRLIPGGPAWRSGILNKGDVILEIRILAKGGKPGKRDETFKAIELTHRRLAELLGGGAKSIGLKVRKPDGLVREVILYRAKLRIEDNIVNSFILAGKKKVGYINLPAFYTQWESRYAPGCAADVAREIIKLNRENIQGLILDLRNNGGGSLREALDLSGIFIDQGPLHIQEGRNGELSLLKDPNRGVIYDGALIVLVNGRSASASEFFVAAMRDHNRALIVGSHTFGKATSQVLLPLNPRNSNNSDFIKLTTKMYFNLKGNSHQVRGLQPDIPLPDNSEMYSREKDLPRALEEKTVRKKVVYKSRPRPDIDDLIDESEDRVSDNSNFETIQAMSRDLKKSLSRYGEFSLGLEDFYERADDFRKSYERYRRALKRRSVQYQVHSHSDDRALEKIDAYRKEINRKRKNEILEDIYIDESYRVMLEYIPLLK